MSQLARTTWTHTHRERHSPAPPASSCWRSRASKAARAGPRGSAPLRCAPLEIPTYSALAARWAERSCMLLTARGRYCSCLPAGCASLWGLASSARRTCRMLPLLAAWRAGSCLPAAPLQSPAAEGHRAAAGQQPAQRPDLQRRPDGWRHLPQLQGIRGPGPAGDHRHPAGTAAVQIQYNVVQIKCNWEMSGSLFLDRGVVVVMLGAH